MRILTYNVRAGRNLDCVPALGRQAAAIRALARVVDEPSASDHRPVLVVADA